MGGTVTAKKSQLYGPSGLVLAKDLSLGFPKGIGLKRSSDHWEGQDIR